MAKTKNKINTVKIHNNTAEWISALDHNVHSLSYMQPAGQSVWMYATQCVVEWTERCCPLACQFQYMQEKTDKTPAAACTLSARKE